MTANDIVSRLERRVPWTSPIIVRNGPDPDAVARLVRQGVIPDPALPVAERKPKKAKTPRRHTGKPPQPRGGGRMEPSFDVDRALILARSGFTSAELAEVFEVNADTIRQQLRRRGFRFTRTFTTDKLDPNEVAKMRALVAEGVCRRQVAKQTGHGYSTVRRYTEDLPLLRASNADRRVPDETAARMETMRGQGATVAQVARDFGINERTVQRAIERVQQTRRQEMVA